MTAGVDPDSDSTLLNGLSELAGRRLGLSFPPDRRPDLVRGIGWLAREYGFADAEACIRWLVTTPWSDRHQEILACCLTVGETYFFRDLPVFQRIEEEILLPLIAERRRQGNPFLRIWSAGCATGEEAFTLAIQLRRLLPDLEDWDLAVLGTDVNPRFLKKASRGSFGQWSFRAPPPWLKADHFSPAENGLRIDEEIRSLVRFELLNLATDSFPARGIGEVDLILCRNVLMYFQSETVRRVLEGFHSVLGRQGWLVVSPCENFRLLAAKFEPVSFPEAVFFRKGARERGRRDSRASISRTGAFPPAAPPAFPVPEKAASRTSPLPAGKKPVEAGKADRKGAPRHPSAPLDRLALAQALLAACRYEEAADLLAEPASPREMTLLAQILANRRQLEEARRWCRRAVEEDKLNPSCHYIFGTIAQERGVFEEAAEAFRRTLYLDPRHLPAHFALGLLFRNQGLRRQARRHLENARSLLKAMPREEVLLELDNINAARLQAMIDELMEGLIE